MKKYIYLLVFAILTFSCTSDDDVIINNEPTLEGSWSLVNVTGGLAGVDDDFETGVILWNFSLQTQQVTVTNNNTTQVIFDGLPTGVYDFEVQTIPEENPILIIESFSLDLSVLTETDLILDEGAFVNDGFQLTFSR